MNSVVASQLAGLFLVSLLLLLFSRIFLFLLNQPQVRTAINPVSMVTLNRQICGHQTAVT